MFKINDLVLYGNIGVCKIKDIALPDISGLDKSRVYYYLKPLYQECIIYTPVDNPKVFMRPIISAAEVEKLIDRIPSIQPEAYYNDASSQVQDHYECLMNTHDCMDLIELTMSINAKKKIVEQQKRKFNTIDERFLKHGEELLFGEMAAALGISKDKVVEYIAERVALSSNKKHLLKAQ